MASGLTDFQFFCGLVGFIIEKSHCPENFSSICQLWAVWGLSVPKSPKTTSPRVIKRKLIYGALNARILKKKLRFQFSISFSNHADFEQLLRIFSCYGLSWRTTFKALCSSHNPPFILAQRKSNKCRISVGVGINLPRFWILPTWNMEIFTNTERNM